MVTSGDFQLDRGRRAGQRRFGLASPGRSLQIWLTLWLLPICLPAAQEPSEWEIESLDDEGHVSWSPDTGLVEALNGVLVKYRDPAYGQAALQADRITLNRLTGRIVAEGRITLQRDDQAWRGEYLEYNFRTDRMEVTDFRTGKSPFFAAGDSVTGSREFGYRAMENYVTTDDVKNPGFRIQARSLKVVPGKHLIARNATVRMGKIPIFYYPWLKIGLDNPRRRWAVTPGYRSRDGAYLLTSYDFLSRSNLTAKLNLDYRSRRGFGGGPELQYGLGPYGSGEFDSYYLHDELPERFSRGRKLDADRYRLRLRHLAEVRTNLLVRVTVDRRSDELILRDFFESEHRFAPQPRSFLEIEKLGANYSLSLIAQPRLHDFYERVERLPELRISAFPQQVASLPLYYESESSAGYLGRKFATADAVDYRAVRADTWHQLTLPRTAFGWLNVNPRAGGRYTYYSATHGNSLRRQDRTVFNTGLELNFKAIRTYPVLTNRFWGLNGLRHIVKPSLNYVYVPEPSALPPVLPQFDSEIPYLRQLPLLYPEYNAIDSVTSRNVVRWGVTHRLLTKRPDTGNVEAYLDWKLFADWRLNPEREEPGLGDLNSELSWRPRSWVSLDSYLRYLPDDGEFRLADHRLTLLSNDRWSLALGHLFLRDEPEYWGLGNNLIYSSLYYRFNENWGTRFSHQFEAKDGTLEEQSYTLYRDFRSWTGALSFRVRDERVLPQDYTLALVFSLKAFPRYDLGEDTVRHSLLYTR